MKKTMKFNAHTLKEERKKVCWQCVPLFEEMANRTAVVLVVLAVVMLLAGVAIGRFFL
jgi:preprotein translocase subunit SecE